MCLYTSPPGTYLNPMRTFSFLLTAFLHTFLPEHPRPTPPPCSMPPIFVDAAHFGSTFLVSAFCPQSFATTVQVPPWVASSRMRSCTPHFTLCDRLFCVLFHVFAFSPTISPHYTASWASLLSHTTQRTHPAAYLSPLLRGQHPHLSQPRRSLFMPLSRSLLPYP